MTIILYLVSVCGFTWSNTKTVGNHYSKLMATRIISQVLLAVFFLLKGIYLLFFCCHYIHSRYEGLPQNY